MFLVDPDVEERGHSHAGFRGPMVVYDFGVEVRCGEVLVPSERLADVEWVQDDAWVTIPWHRIESIEWETPGA